MRPLISCWLPLALALGAAVPGWCSGGAGAVLKMSDGRELRGELTLTNNQFFIIRPEKDPVLVGLTNFIHGRFNLTNLTLSGNSDRDPANPTLPAPWQARQVGGTGELGKVTFSKDRFVLEGAGRSFITDEADNFFFVHRPLYGEGEIIARIVSLEGKSAGVMIRDRDRTNAACAAAFAQPLDLFSYRDRPGAKKGGGQTRDRTFVNLPRYVRLKREGNMLKSYISWDNGEHWESFHRGPVEMGRQVDIGLFVVGRATGSVARAEFDRVTVSQVERPDDRAQNSFVVLCSGTSIAGQVVSIDGSLLKMQRLGRAFTVSTPNVARVLFGRALTPEEVQAIPNRPGVLLERNDFIDGDVHSLEDGRLKVASVLFGFRTFRAGSQVKAAVLRGLAPATTECVISMRDGSIWRAQEARLDESDLKARIPELGLVTLPWREVSEINRP